MTTSTETAFTPVERLFRGGAACDVEVRAIQLAAATSTKYDQSKLHKACLRVSEAGVDLCGYFFDTPDGFEEFRSRMNELNKRLGTFDQEEHPEEWLAVCAARLLATYYSGSSATGLAPLEREPKQTSRRAQIPFATVVVVWNEDSDEDLSIHDQVIDEVRDGFRLYNDTVAVLTPHSSGSIPFTDSNSQISAPIVDALREADLIVVESPNQSASTRTQAITKLLDLAAFPPPDRNPIPAEERIPAFVFREHPDLRPTDPFTESISSTGEAFPHGLAVAIEANLPSIARHELRRRNANYATSRGGKLKQFFNRSD